MFCITLIILSLIILFFIVVFNRTLFLFFCPQVFDHFIKCPHCRGQYKRIQLKNSSLLDLHSIVRLTAMPSFWYVPWRDVHLPCRFWHKLFSDIKRILLFFQFSVLNLLTTSSVNATKSAVSCEISRRRVPYINKCAY